MTDDALFGRIESWQGDRPWGSVLDAGTGQASLAWIAGLPTTHWTAVTGDPARARSLQSEWTARMRPLDRILCGNWTDPALLHGEAHDVVVADYLLGAVDGYAPYFQDRLFARLRPLTKERLYAVGLAPYPASADDLWGRLLLDIVRLRDACILLAGDRMYREYPLDWVLRHLEAADFVVDEAVSVPIRYGRRFVRQQLDVAAKKLPRIDDAALARRLEHTIADLRERALACYDDGGARPFGEDWVVSARPA
jgi:hypothetical protein